MQLTLEGFKNIVDNLYMLHPDASVQFVYPGRAGKKRVGKMGD